MRLCTLSAYQFMDNKYKLEVYYYHISVCSGSQQPGEEGTVYCRFKGLKKLRKLMQLDPKRPLILTPGRAEYYPRIYQRR